MLNRKLKQVKTSLAAALAAVAFAAQAHMQPLALPADRLTKLDEALVASLVLPELPRPVAAVTQDPLPVVAVVETPVVRVDLTVMPRKAKVDRRVPLARPQSVVRLATPSPVMSIPVTIAVNATERDVMAEYLPAGAVLPPQQIRSQARPLMLTQRRVARRALLSAPVESAAPARQLALPAPMAFLALPFYPEVAEPTLAEQLATPYAALTDMYFAGWRAWTSMFVAA